MTNTADTYVVANSTYSNIAWYDNASISTDFLQNNVTIHTGFSGADIDAMDEAENTYFNFDFTSFNTTKTVSKVCLVNGTLTAMSDVVCGADFEYKGIVEIKGADNQSGPMHVNVTFSTDSQTSCYYNRYTFQCGFTGSGFISH
jgi:hypothetical protein